MNSVSWHPFDFDLKFHFGEFTAACVPLRVQRRVYTLEEIRNCTCIPELPALASDQAGYLLANIPTPGKTLDFPIATSYLRYCLKSYMRCYIDMTMNFDQYKAKFSGKSRSGINRKIKRFTEEAEGLDFRCYRSPDEIKRFFELARPVSASSYQERLLDCGLPKSPDYLAAAVAAAEHDGIRAFLLFADGKPVSYLYCPVEDQVLHYAYLGYLPDYSKLSPGTVLQWLAMEQLFAEGKFTAFDFTEGDSDHKRFFSTHQIPCGLWLLLKPNIKNRMLLTLHNGVDRSTTLFTRILDKLHLKQKIKRWIRRTA
ncbi:GNAT family N-acetyltransferase [Nitrosomonas sp.]|uniref:GNAT family N-acetyltransferase n=1 Tax=Nitrosomonas sp. TaxID=42353 RepID=UPI003305C3B1